MAPRDSGDVQEPECIYACACVRRCVCVCERNKFRLLSAATTQNTAHTLDPKEPQMCGSRHAGKHKRLDWYVPCTTRCDHHHFVPCCPLCSLDHSDGRNFAPTCCTWFRRCKIFFTYPERFRLENLNLCNRAHDFDSNSCPCTFCKTLVTARCQKGHRAH